MIFLNLLLNFQLNNSSLWYRTVLQVILLENFYIPVENEEINKAGNNNNNNKSAHLFRNKSNADEIIEPTRIQVGRNLIRENKTSPDFCSYVRKALDKLKFTNHEQEVK